MGRLCVILSVFQAIYLLDVSSQYFYEIKKDTEWDLAENGLMLGEEIFKCNLDDACKRVVTRQNKKVYEKQYDGQLGMQGQLNSTVLPGNKTGKAFIIRHSSGKCMALNPKNDFIISTSCEDRFMFLADQHLKHVNSGQCVKPHTGGEDGDKIQLANRCDLKGSQFMQTGQHAIQSIKYQKCIQPQGKKSVPDDGTILVLGPICNFLRVRFDFVWE